MFDSFRLSLLVNSPSMSNHVAMPTGSQQRSDINENEKVLTPLGGVCVCGVALVAIFALLHWISPPFEYGSKIPRPYISVVGLLLIGSVISLIGLGRSLHVPLQDRKKLLLLIVCFGLSARLIAIFTCPILEIDYYRYMWDGKVAAAGISPYQFSPDEALETKAANGEVLNRLRELASRSESNHTIATRVHFSNYTTIYPPVSQLFFAATMSCIPDSTSVEAHIFAIKFMLVLFDLGTLGLICFLLQILGRRMGWLIVYAWNPLVIKEIANGGHLDSIATFFAFASLVLLAKWSLSQSPRRARKFLVATAAAIGLGVGAKLFPVVLTPAMVIYVSRRSWTQAGLLAVLFVVFTGLTMSPMIYSLVAKGNTVELESVAAEPGTTDAKDGAIGFFSRWRINDVAFSGVYFNLKDSSRAAERTPWFVVTSREFRKRFEGWCRDRSFGGERPAFFAAKACTMAVFLAFYLWQLVLLRRTDAAAGDERGEFLNLMRRLAVCMAVFLFLQPTVNPWYLVWIMPLACFSNNRGWLLVSGLLSTYYIRFWFKTIEGGPYTLFGREYSGVGIYDHLVVWVVMACILGAFILAARRSSNAPVASL